MSEKKRKVIDIVTRVLMWVSMLGALFSAVATQLADAGLELPAVVSGVVSVVVLVGRFARNLAPKLPELLLILGLSGVAVAGSGIIDGQDLENIPQSKHDQLIEYIDTLDAVENEADTEATEPDPDPD